MAGAAHAAASGALGTGFGYLAYRHAYVKFWNGGRAHQGRVDSTYVLNAPPRAIHERIRDPRVLDATTPSWFRLRFRTEEDE